MGSFPRSEIEPSQNSNIEANMGAIEHEALCACPDILESNHIRLPRSTTADVASRRGSFEDSVLSRYSNMKPVSTTRDIDIDSFEPDHVFQEENASPGHDTIEEGKDSYHNINESESFDEQLVSPPNSFPNRATLTTHKTVFTDRLTNRRISGSPLGPPHHTSRRRKIQTRWYRHVLPRLL